MKNAYDYLVKNDIISKNMKGVISIKCYALDGREIYNGLNDNAIKKLKGFIDQEELKNKIKKLNYSLDIRDKMPYKQKVYLEEVLELIK